MKKTKKILSLVLALLMLVTTLSTFGMTAFALYGGDGDAWHFYFYLDRIPGVDGYPGETLDKSITYSAYDKDSDSVTGDLTNGGTTVSPNHSTIQPDTSYTYTIRLNYNDADPMYYGYSNDVSVEWNLNKYSSTYDAGHYASESSSGTYSIYGFVTPKTCSTYTVATAATSELVYNGEEQSLIDASVQQKSSDRVTISYKVDNGEWVTDTSNVTAKDAGTHTVYWKVTGEGVDSRKTNEGSFTKEIKKLSVTVTPDSDQSKIYGKLDPTFTYTSVATNGAEVVPAVDVDETTGLFKNGAISRTEGENYTKDGYTYTIGTLQTENATNYDFTFVDNTTVFMINRKDITADDVTATLETPDGGFDGNIYQYYYKHGQEIIPAISLIYSGAEVESIKNENLELNKDYNITDGKTVKEYINHDATNEVITIRGTGNYIGVTTLDWRVIKLNLGDITSDKYEAAYDGQEHSMKVNLSETAITADAEITYIYDADSDTVYNAENWDYEKATAENPKFKDVLVDSENKAIARTVYYRVHSEQRDGGGSLIYNDYYGCEKVLIQKKNVNLVAEDKTKVYDKNESTDPELTYADYKEQMVGEEVLDGIAMSRVEGQDAGKYAVSFNLESLNLLNPNYNVTETKGNFEITSRPVKVSVGDYEKIYSEVNPTLALDIEKAGDEGVAEFEGLLPSDILFDESKLGETLTFIDENNKSFKYDRFIDAGQYIIGKGDLANSNYDINFTNGLFTVYQKDITLPDTNVVMLYNGSRTDPVFTYTGKTITPEFTMSDMQDGVEYVNYESDIDYEVKGVYKASDYGFFGVSIKGIHNYKGEIFGKWAILPVIDETYDYDGNEHKLTFNLGESLADGTATEIRFSETAPEEPVTKEDYNLTEAPSYTAPGVYSIYYGIVKNPEEYGEEGVFAGVATLTINKLEQSELVEYNIPTAVENLVYNTQAQLLVTAPVSLPMGCDKIMYSIDGGETWTENAEATNAGEYTVKVKYVGMTNYDDQYGEDIAVSIAVAEINPTVEISGWTYGDAAATPIVSGNTDNAPITYLYKVKGASDMGCIEEAPKDAGNYTVKAIVAATDNCCEGEASADFTIAKRPVTIKAEDKTIKKDADFIAPTYVVDGAVVEGDDLGVKLTTKAKASTAGTFDIIVSCTNKNYKATLDNATYTVTDRISPQEKAKAKNKINSCAKATVSKNGSISLNWGAVEGADKIEVYAAYCKASAKYKRIATLKGSATGYKVSKINGKKVDNKKAVKLYIVAYRKVNSKYTCMAKTLPIHIAGAKYSKTNAKAIKVKKTSYTLKVKKTAAIKPSIVRENSKKKLIEHVAKFRYQSTNTAVATVDKNGKIKAVGKGTCTIYIFANNGKMKKVKVTVK